MASKSSAFSWKARRAQRIASPPASTITNAPQRPFGVAVLQSSGWTRGRSPTSVTSDEVPVTSEPRPGRHAPEPRSAIGKSDDDASTGVPARSAVSSAAFAVTAPRMSVGRRIGGSFAPSTPRRSSISGDHVHVRASIMNVSEASVTSRARAPVSRKLTQSFGMRSVAVRS